MKRLLICSVIMTAVTAMSIYSYNYCENTATSISLTLSEISESCEKGDYETAQEKAKSARITWQNISENTVFVEDTECDNEISMTLARIEEMAKRQSDDIFYECTVADELLQTFITRQKPTWGNVL